MRCRTGGAIAVTGAPPVGTGLAELASSAQQRAPRGAMADDSAAVVSGAVTWFSVVKGYGAALRGSPRGAGFSRRPRLPGGVPARGS